MTGVIEPDRATRRKPHMRSDALANQERLLAAAVTAMLRDGRQVPMASIARDAGVGIGTLYRNYPTREALLDALTVRSFELVLDAVEKAALVDGPAISALESFFASTIAHRDQLVLPLHGGPVDLSEESLRIQGKIRDAVDQTLERGRKDRTIRDDVTSADVVFFGAMLAQPLSTDEEWLETNLSRQQQIFLAGLAPAPSRLTSK